MKNLLEACLFVASEPVLPAETAKVFATDPEAVVRLLDELAAEYEARGGGMRIARVGGGYQMVTHPDLSEDLARFLAGPAGKPRLSRAALETVAIVAYRQPTTIAEIEAIRGVSAERPLHTLIDRKLIREAGRKPVPGRPILYETTPEFLHYFGLNALGDLPPMDEESGGEEEREHVLHEVEAAVGLTES